MVSWRPNIFRGIFTQKDLSYRGVIYNTADKVLFFPYSRVVHGTWFPALTKTLRHINTSSAQWFTIIDGYL